MQTNRRKTILLLSLLLTVLLCSCAALVGVLMVNKNGAGGMIRPEMAAATANGVSASSSSNDETATEKQAAAPVDDEGNFIVTEELIAGSSFDDLMDYDEVDLDVRNHTPKEKRRGIDWDRTLFYWLEDTDINKDDDNHIAECVLTHIQMRKVGGGEIEFEVYSDPDNGKVYKIVTIERVSDSLYELCDYYFDEGKPNFIFHRTDSVYTPTYATISKPGERYYFYDDVMVRYRRVEENLEKSQISLTLHENSPVNENSYDSMPAYIRKNYDQLEKEWLNRAYAVYDAVNRRKDGEGIGPAAIGMVQGTVRNTAEEPLAGRDIYIQSLDDGRLRYHGNTGDDGTFRIYVYLDGVPCQLYVMGDKEYEGTYVYNVRMSGASLNYVFDPIVLHRFNGDPHRVDLQIRAANDIDTANRSLSKGLVGASVAIRPGVDATNGKTVWEGKSDGAGQIHVSLTPGSYTAEVEKDGYARIYVSITVFEKDVSENVFMVKSPDSGYTAVLLVWDSLEDRDLDLTIFTPWQEEEGNMGRIGGKTLSDEHKNYIVRDNASECEVAYFNTSVRGIYKIYVSDYTDIQAGNPDVDVLKGIHARIYILRSDGVVAEIAPSAGKGVIWEVADVSGNMVTKPNRIYSDITGKPWWSEDKKEVSYQELLIGEWYYPGNNRSSTIFYEDGHVAGYDYIENDSYVLEGDQLTIYGQTYGTDRYTVKRLDESWLELLRYGEKESEFLSRVKGKAWVTDPNLWTTDNGEYWGAEDMGLADRSGIPTGFEIEEGRVCCYWGEPFDSDDWSMAQTSVYYSVIASNGSFDIYEEPELKMCSFSYSLTDGGNTLNLHDNKGGGDHIYRKSKHQYGY